MLKKKAEHFGEQFGRSFSATEGWLSRWKGRHGIKFKKAHGEKSSANVDAASLWVRDRLPQLLETFNDDIFNADETGLFYRATPDESLCYKSEKLSGSKKAMQRVTVMC